MNHINTSILVVDDSDTQRQLLAHQLNDESYHVIEAKNGKEGLNLAKEKQPALIITDILMPEMDGYEMVRRLKEEEKLFNIQIIFYTGHYQENEAKKLADSFDSFYLKKPAPKEVLLNLIQITLQKKTIKKLSTEEFHDISRQHLDLITNKLYQRVKELEKLNSDLEERISERTRELEIVNKRLHDESIQDPLTGIFNRRFLHETLTREVAISKRHKRHFLFVMVDIDNFKMINDKYGHRGGDIVLYTVAQFLKNKVRGEDVVCRFGGDEFALIMPEIQRNKIIDFLNEIRLGVTNLQIDNDGKLIKSLTISIGAALSSETFNNSHELIEAADQSLYKAKMNGRNCVVVHENKILGSGTNSS